jgi:hypothetical protein
VGWGGGGGGLQLRNVTLPTSGGGGVQVRYVTLYTGDTVSQSCIFDPSCELAPL